ncbi:MAG: yjdF [Mucilaginibacter sp.]|nr:yjdF [Mucilaginibacter sp.]
MKKYYLLIFLFFSGLIISAISPHDYFTWALEVFPAIIGFIVLSLTFKHFHFTYLTSVMILLHCFILFIGGHYTYAMVPAFSWIKDIFHQSRNNYDKFGHFFQGFVPAMIVREMFIRLDIINKKTWIPFLTIAVCGFISLLYELLEWLVSVSSGSAGDSFLGTQGDIWDTQSDMLFAIIGAVFMLLFVSKWQNKEIKKFRPVSI